MIFQGCPEGPHADLKSRPDHQNNLLEVQGKGGQNHLIWGPALSKLPRRNLPSMLHFPSLNLCPSPHSSRFLRDPTVPPSTDYCPDCCFCWSKTRGFHVPDIAPSPPIYPFSISLPESLSQVFTRYFIRKKFKKVIYAKGVHDNNGLMCYPFQVIRLF